MTKRGGKEMTTITLNQIRTRIRQDSDKKEKSIEKFISNIQKKNMNKGRVRPKHPTESNILSRFSKK